MQFTDDDLKDMISRLDPKGMRPLVGLPLEKWRGLVARLTAAEAALLRKDCACDMCNAYGSAVRKWRKAAGRL